MHHTAGMRVRKGIGDVVHDAHHIARAKAAFACNGSAQRFAFDKRHGEPQQPAAFTGRQQRHNVRMLQLRGDLDFAAEPFVIHTGREVGR